MTGFELALLWVVGLIVVPPAICVVIGTAIHQADVHEGHAPRKSNNSESSQTTGHKPDDRRDDTVQFMPKPIESTENGTTVSSSIRGSGPNLRDIMQGGSSLPHQRRS